MCGGMRATFSSPLIFHLTYISMRTWHVQGAINESSYFDMAYTQNKHSSKQTINKIEQIRFNILSRRKRDVLLNNMPSEFPSKRRLKTLLRQLQHRFLY